MSVSSLPAKKKPLLSDGTYNVLKHVAQVGLPAVGALYAGLSQIWHLPDTEQVVATVATVNTALGLLLHYSTFTYNNSDTKYAGVINIAENEAKQVFSLDLNHEPEALKQMATATFKVATAAAEQAASTPSGFAQPENPPTLGR